MNNFDIPKGIQRNVTEKGDESTEYTIWTGVADLANLKYYYRVYENPSIYELDLKEQDPTGKTVLKDDRPSNGPIVTVPVQFSWDSCGLSFRWARLVSNQRPLACEASALPLSYAP